MRQPGRMLFILGFTMLVYMMTSEAKNESSKPRDYKGLHLIASYNTEPATPRLNFRRNFPARSRKNSSAPARYLQFTQIKQKSSTRQKKDVVQVKMRYRRMLGHRTRCISVVKVFCKVFTRLDVTEEFCLTAPVKVCWGLD